MRATPSAPFAQGHQRTVAAPFVHADESAGAPVGAEGSAQRSPASTDASAGSNEKPGLIATPENVATWIAQATGTDAARRAAAIEALGSAPKADAVPVLERVLKIADESDRPRALSSLRTLAQREGDADDRIRSVVRNIVFHADDEAATQAAQTMLDEIERDLSQARTISR